MSLGCVAVKREPGCRLETSLRLLSSFIISSETLCEPISFLVPEITSRFFIVPFCFNLSLSLYRLSVSLSLSPFLLFFSLSLSLSLSHSLSLSLHDCVCVCVCVRVRVCVWLCVCVCVSLSLSLIKFSALSKSRRFSSCLAVICKTRIRGEGQ